MSDTSGRAVAVVVDGYSAGNFYPPAFAELGVDLVHVQSTPELIPAMAPPQLSRYRENILGADEREWARRLRPYEPVCVVAGQESAVEPTDRLAEELRLPGNGTRLSTARRDKYEMVETLRRSGVRCARQFKSDSPRALARWAEHNDDYPVVVKPLSSAASDGVTICFDADEVATAAESVLASQNIFGTANTEILVQSYLAGTEYIVDTVSCDGHHYVCGVWEYEKTLLPSGDNIYNRDILADPSREPVPALIDYAHEVLDALDVRWGPAHAEIIMTEQGPALVEIGTRLNGNLDAGFHDVCLGHNQAALSALAYVSPETFLRRYTDRVYTKHQPAFVYNTPTELDGTVESVDQEVVDEIRGLESVHHAAVKVAAGGRIRPTTDLLTSSMRVFLTAPEESRLEADYEKVRSLKDSVYQLAEQHADGSA
ncbi:phosphoribosylglycinamide synthetase [Actinopolyspora erythraea]|uniref:Phosphoribosylglycinamide synthetase n=1 Tax=Actinopolyspora erythraea TaxID=414996 RepID=A0A099D5H2_9ACTN|nr:ATP-grasp domain-containing protein [Actinopolyspora erythraea]ASU78659.1 phosphoribosylglycinamide synthetase [Actinopolyspora erythraea]KGI81418.1 phosphoribosylglycinamide synthetase [Actinopolyspora erythraea]